MLGLLSIVGCGLIGIGLLYCIGAIFQLCWGIIIFVLQMLGACMGGIFCTIVKTAEDVSDYADSEIREAQRNQREEERAQREQYYRQRQQDANARALEINNAIQYQAEMLRRQYPLADRELFDRYVRDYNHVALSRIEVLIDMMKNQQMERSNAQQRMISYNNNLPSLITSH